MKITMLRFENEFDRGGPIFQRFYTSELKALAAAERDCKKHKWLPAKNIQWRKRRGTLRESENLAPYRYLIVSVRVR